MWPTVPRVLNSHATPTTIIVAIVILGVVLTIFGRWLFKIVGNSED